MRAVRRRDHVGRLERLADPDGDALLADRDVDEAGDLARHVLLLDLLLDAPDDEHLVEEREQLLAGECLFLFDSGHRRRTVYADSPMTLDAAMGRGRAGIAGQRGQTPASHLPYLTRTGRQGNCPPRPAATRTERRHDPLHHRAPRRGLRPRARPQAPAQARRGEDPRHAELVSSGEPPRAGARPRHLRRRVGGGARRSCRPTGATSTPRSSSSRPTGSSRPRSCIGPGQPGPLRRHAGFRFRVREPLRLRRLDADDAPLPGAPRRSRRSPASCASCASSPTPATSPRRVPVWYVGGKAV